MAISSNYLSLFAGAGGRGNSMIGDGLTKDQRYYRKNKAKNAAKVKRWLDKHPGANAAACRRYYEKSSVAQRAKAKVRYERVVKPHKRTDKGRLAERIKFQNRRKQTVGTVTAAEWSEILTEHNNHCHWCGNRGPLEIDHIIPISKGGPHHKDNIVPACKPCNTSRGNRHATPPRLGRTQ